MENENNTRKLLALGADTAKMTAENLYQLINTYLNKKDSGELAKEEMTYEEFQNPGGISLVNVAINTDNIAVFEAIALEQDVKFGLKKDKENSKSYVFFQGSEKNIEKAFASFQNRFEKERHEKIAMMEKQKEKESEKSKIVTQQVQSVQPVQHLKDEEREK